MNHLNCRFCDGKPRRGFTLVELMVVIVIIGILAGFVGVSVIGHIAKAKVTNAKAQIKTFHNAVNFYHLDTGRYPDNSIGLDALVTQPPDVTGWNRNGYLEGVRQVPIDPWGNDYFYQYPGDRSTTFDIYSLGADGLEGGEGPDADIYNSDVVGTETDTETPGDDQPLL